MRRGNEDAGSLRARLDTYLPYCAERQEGERSREGAVGGVVVGARTSGAYWNVRIDG